MSLSSVLGDLLEDGGVVDLGSVGGLDLVGDTDELLPQVGFGRGVEHLGLDLASIGGPEDKDDLVVGCSSYVCMTAVSDILLRRG